MEWKSIGSPNLRSPNQKKSKMKSKKQKRKKSQKNNKKKYNKRHRRWWNKNPNRRHKKWKIRAQVTKKRVKIQWRKRIRIKWKMLFNLIDKNRVWLRSNLNNKSWMKNQTKSSLISNLIKYHKPNRSPFHNQLRCLLSR